MVPLKEQDERELAAMEAALETLPEEKKELFLDALEADLNRSEFRSGRVHGV